MDQGRPAWSVISVENQGILEVALLLTTPAANMMLRVYLLPHILHFQLFSFYPLHLNANSFACTTPLLNPPSLPPYPKDHPPRFISPILIGILRSKVCKYVYSELY
jgi:hypothetical protein